MEWYQCIDRTIKSNDPEINSDIHTNIYEKNTHQLSMIKKWSFNQMVLEEGGWALEGKYLYRLSSNISDDSVKDWLKI